MEGKSHFTVGVAAGAVAAALIGAPFSNQVVMMLAGGVGGWVPDLDSAQSTLGKRLPGVWHDVTPGHRRFSHSLFSLPILYGIAYVIQYYGDHHFGWWDSPAGWAIVPLALTAGSFSHMVTDGMTTLGNPFFYPFSKRKIKLLNLIGLRNFKTGSQPEFVFALVVQALTAALVAAPMVIQVMGDRVHTPPVMGLPTESVAVFLALAIFFGMALTIRAMRKAKAKRRAQHRRQPPDLPARRSSSGTRRRSSSGSRRRAA